MNQEINKGMNVEGKCDWFYYGSVISTISQE